MILNNLLSNLNATPEIAEKIGKYFLNIANKKRNKDSGNNGDDDDDDDHDHDMYPNIKKYRKNILNDDSITPEYIEKLSNKFLKLANEMRSKDNEDDSENNDDNDDSDDNDDNHDNDDNGNDNGNINTNPKKGSGMFTSQKEFAKLLTFLAQLHAGNNSKKLKNDINRLLKALYNSKQISELVHENLIAAI